MLIVTKPIVGSLEGDSTQPPEIELGATPLSDERERLFRPFTRLNQLQTEGHGLGLSIVRRIVEK